MSEHSDPDVTRRRRVALVTGASRGAGRGIAAALGAQGYAVVVTGRTADPGHELGGTVGATARAVSRRGGEGIAVVCDHRDDAQTRAVVEVVRERFGHLDLLVNNAFAVPDDLVGPEPFWEKPLDLLAMLEVGLRSSYVMTHAAAPLLLAPPEGRAPLVVMTSGFGARCYLHGPAYGAVKAGVDKMAHDMAVDFAREGVTVVSLWLGLLRTERTLRTLDDAAERYPVAGGGLVTESPEFPGRVIAALDRDTQKLERSGQVLVGAELGRELGVLDVDGTAPVSRRDMLGGPPPFHPAVVR